MKKITTIASTLLIALTTSSAFAKIYRCPMGDEVTFQNKPCPVSESEKGKGNAFGFDHWVFGTSIAQMKIISHRRRVGIRPGTFIAQPSSVFNKKSLDQNPDARIFTYWTKVMGKRAKTSLFFTKGSEELYQIKVRVIAPNSKEERKFFFESLYELLNKKYGKAKITSKKDISKMQIHELIGTKIMSSLSGKLLVWGDGTPNVITLPYRKNYQFLPMYELSYSYMPLVLQSKKEITYELQNRTKKAAIMDSGKL